MNTRMCHQRILPHLHPCNASNGNKDRSGKVLRQGARRTGLRINPEEIIISHRDPVTEIPVQAEITRNGPGKKRFLFSNECVSKNILAG